ncbi:hypothetical protein J7F01_30055 [Streptomyces sp. ISL-22]|uniref:Uncharacterized protein n=1 Tax=Streptomyces curacoi TaxID=146536 RepID=A0A117PH45_9ACTN|nr:MULTISPECIES: hypothetical protein [Streptomyces]KUM79586.1 hypothetical protein AQI70_09525 [Streptomyces curacoi]MBT2421696.1 hypothetical protein [Streptomyces sp. ISL-24]MBT2436334.1 hypothetical protein [Streptomyces sp. ISL-22]
MAFGVEELRVLRRALALALHPSPASAEDVQECLHLAESLDEAMREGARLRAFLVADLARYRAALPGATAGYLTLLEEVLDAGHHPSPDDLAALHALRANPTAAALLDRCQTLATPTVPAARTRLLALPGGLSGHSPGTTVDLPAQPTGQEPAKQPRKKPAEKPAAPKPGPGPESTPAAPRPSRPIPTPGEVFPRRKPTPPPANPPQQLAAG